VGAPDRPLRWNDGKTFDAVPIPLPFTHDEATQSFDVAFS
jgi:hypothetical protein